MTIRTLMLVLALSFASLLAVAQEPVPKPIAGRYVIDVRSDAEWRKAHIAGAIHIAHTEIGQRIELVLPDRAAPIGLYCGSGKRAGAALETLRSMGYTDLENLGGMEAARQRLAGDDAAR